MKKGAVMLVSATCIGGGMIALPMMLAQLGIAASILLMLAIWLFVYYSSLVNLELNLQAGEGMSLGALGNKFSGKGAAAIGVISLKMLSYALLSVYIYGGSSVLQKMASLDSFALVSSFYAFVAVLFLLIPIKLLDYINRLLFIGFLVVVGILVAGLLSSVNWHNLPIFSDSYKKISVWMIVIPVVFTAFGFQVIFHTLTNYCQKDSRLLKTVFFWGSLIPAFVYIIWTFSVLSVVYNENPSFYQQMVSGNINVGDLVQALSSIAKLKFVQLLIWWITLLAIITSILGVGVGLCDALKDMLKSKIKNNSIRNVIAAIVTILPAYLVAILIPNAFISVLAFAGMILVVIAILLPIYLFNKGRFKNIFYSELKNGLLMGIVAILGVIIIICELVNIFAHV